MYGNDRGQGYSTVTFNWTHNSYHVNSVSPRTPRDVIICALAEYRDTCSVASAVNLIPTVQFVLLENYSDTLDFICFPSENHCKFPNNQNMDCCINQIISILLS